MEHIGILYSRSLRFLRGTIFSTTALAIFAFLIESIATQKFGISYLGVLTILGATLLLAYALADFGLAGWFKSNAHSTRRDNVRTTMRVTLAAVALATLLPELALDSTRTVSSSDQYFFQLTLTATLFGLLLYVIEDFYHLYRREARDDSSSQDRAGLELMTRTGDRATGVVAALLRARAQRLNAFSVLMLALIGGVLILGFRLFTTAEQTADQTVNLSDLRKQLALQSGELARVTSLLDAPVPSNLPAQSGAAIDRRESISQLLSQKEQLSVAIDGLAQDVEAAKHPPTEATTDQPWRRSALLPC